MRSMKLLDLGVRTSWSIITIPTAACFGNLHSFQSARHLLPHNISCALHDLILGVEPRQPLLRASLGEHTRKACAGEQQLVVAFE